MGELGGHQEYLYWSNRQVARVLDGNNINLRDPGQTKIGSPNILDPIAKIERTISDAPKGRRDVTSMIFEAIGGSIVSNIHDAPAPIRFACGVGSVSFGQFRSTRGVQKPLKGIVHPCQNECHGEGVAICLFGSLENFEGFLPGDGVDVAGGWSISTAPGIQHFLSHNEVDGQVLRSLDELADEAVKVATCEGIKRNPMQPDGSIEELDFGELGMVAEWCARIFSDIDVSGNPLEGHSRVLIGAPLWVRTPSLQSLEYYQSIGTPVAGGSLSGSGSIRNRLKRAVAAFRGTPE